MAIFFDYTCARHAPRGTHRGAGSRGSTPYSSPVRPTRKAGAVRSETAVEAAPPSMDADLPPPPQDHHNSMAEFLEAKGYVEQALTVATDENYKFDLAVQLGRLDVAMSIAEALNTPRRWKQLGELALSRGDIQLAEDCYIKGKDLSGLLLIYQAKADAEGMETLVSMAKEEGKMNIAFLVLFLLGRMDECMGLLAEAGRYPEAALLARTYLPSKMSDAVKSWKQDLSTKNKTAAESLADPEAYSNLFPDLEVAIQAEGLRNQMSCLLYTSDAADE